MQKPALFLTALALALAALPAVALHSRGVGETAMAGTYTVTLSLPGIKSLDHPEAETKPGASPETMRRAERPNHDLVALVTKNGKPAETATVAIRYRELAPKQGFWQSVPVVRLREACHGLNEACFGNEVMLAAGHYEAEVSVNGSPPAIFYVAVSK